LIAMLVVLLALFCAVQGQALVLKELHTLHQWTNLSLGDDLSKGNRFLPVDVDIEYGDEGRHRTFLTIPRLGMTTPFTLATVIAEHNELVENPRLEPYPNEEWHVPPNNCSGITSAIRTYVSNKTYFPNRRYFMNIYRFLPDRRVLATLGGGFRTGKLPAVVPAPNSHL